MMGVLVDLAGKRFGHLIAVERVGANARRQSLWKVRCDCGGITTVIGTKLSQGRQTSCGCQAKNRFADIAGQQFGRLTALAPVGRAQRGIKWLALCDCGTVTEVSGAKLRNGHTRSCGCLQREVAGGLNRSHGMSSTATYSSWQAMWQRTTNPRTEGFKNYGGRGITVCKRWRSFQNFLLDMGEKPKGLTIERTNNNKGYMPSNCIWADMATQNKNRRPRGSA